MEANNTNKIVPEDAYIAAITSIAEALGWSVYSDESEIEFSQHSPAGEDFSFSVEKKNVVGDVRRYVTDFDTDEHIQLWAQSAGRNGVPRFKELVEDAEAIKDMLEDLASALEAYREPRYVVIAMGTDDNFTEGPMAYQEAIERVLEVKQACNEAHDIISDGEHLDICDMDEADSMEVAYSEYYQTAFIRKAPETLVEKLILELDKADHAVTQYSFELMDTGVIRNVLSDIEQLIVANVPDHLGFAEDVFSDEEVDC